MTGPVGWTFDPGAIAFVLALGAAYALRVSALRQAGRPVSLGRRISFYLGLLTLLAAFVSPVDSIGENRVFYVHMVQHLMLLDLAPLLMVLGLTGPILRPFLALPGVARLRALAHPLPALAIWATVLYAWHLPGPYEQALAHPAVHLLEHLSFLTAGLLLWAAVLEPLPGPAWFGNGAKAAYVLVVRALGGALGVLFLIAGQPLYPDYAAGERLWHISPLTDQRIGGAIMSIEGALVTLFAFAWLFLRWLREAELQQSLVEAGTEPARAERAARYGPLARTAPSSAAAASSSARSRS
jgi:cytochrome c oxidase assembly factor CtaG